MKVYIITYNVNRRFREAGRGGIGRLDAGSPDSQNFFYFFIFQYDLVTSSSLFVTFTVQKQW